MPARVCTATQHTCTQIASAHGRTCSAVRLAPESQMSWPPASVQPAPQPRKAVYCTHFTPFQQRSESECAGHNHMEEMQLLGNVVRADAHPTGLAAKQIQ